jgi:hypothetical protein
MGLIGQLAPTKSGFVKCQVLCRLGSLRKPDALARAEIH